MFFRPILMSCLLFLTACTSLPERPSVGRNGAGKVGYWVELHDSLMHSHAGGGISGGYNRPYPDISWGLTEYVNSRLADKLKSSTQFQLIDLKAAGYQSEELLGLVSLQDGQFIVTDIGRMKSAKLWEQLGLDFVVVIRPQMTSAISGCTPFGYCTSVDGIGMGLFTKGVMFGYEYKGILGASFTVYSLSPAAVLSAYAPSAMPNLMFPINSFSKPASWKNITEQEWLPVKNEVLAAADDLVNRVVNNILGIDAECPYQGRDNHSTFVYGPKLGCTAQASVGCNLLHRFITIVRAAD